MRRRANILCLCAGLFAAAGCYAPPDPDFNSPEPIARVDAALVAAGGGGGDQGSEERVPELIELLGSDDPLARMVAIRTLERLTGQTLGYEHDAADLERRRAADRWAQWWIERSGYDAPAAAARTDANARAG
ncbi:MAG: hypothetical protein AAGK04_13040 [Planctomycetota bacterium]